MAIAQEHGSARFAILWFTINLLPVLNLGAFGEEFLVQERYVYISSIGFSLLLAMGLVKIPDREMVRSGQSPHRSSRARRADSAFADRERQSRKMGSGKTT